MASGCGLVPVELEFFRVSMEDDQSALLKWVTATEIDNKGFEIQRMSGVNFSWETVGFVEGQGNSNVINEYSFVDERMPLGINYYRLKQMDYNGTITYSLIEEVNRDAKAVFTVWPTLARDYVFMAIHDDYRNEEVIVQVRDLMGKKMVEQSSQNTAIDIQSFSAGHYLISFYVRGQMYTQQFVKVD